MGYAMHQVLERRLSFLGVEFAVKIFTDHHLGRQLRKMTRHLDVLLLEYHLAVLIRNGCGAPFPFQFIERMDIYFAEVMLDWN